MSLSKKQVFPPSPRTERGKPTHISGDLKNKRDIVYTAGQVVVVRNLEDPTQCYLYTNHQHPVAVAKMAPSGNYIASADTNGQCQIWDTLGEGHICVLERDVVDTPMDIDWSDDSKRCVVVGAGRSRMGDAFFTDTGAAVGTISGHSNPILTCSVRHTRPFRLATGSEDRKINIFPGPPYNFETSLTNHSKYVNCVRYSPNGEFLLSVGGDKLVALFDGKESTLIRSSDEGHTGSVYSASWSEDSTRFLTGGADKTARVWDASSLTVLQTFTFPNNINNFQVGTLWQGNNLITVNLRGDITYLDETSPDQPLRVIHGHPRRIINLEYDRVNNYAYTTDGTGYTIQWREGTADTRVFEENILDNVVQSKLANGLLYLISVDGSLGAGSVDSFETVGKVTFGVLPRSFDVFGEDAIVILEDQKALFISNFEVVGEMNLGYDAAVIAISPDGSKVAIGGNDNHVRVYNRSGNSLTHAYDCKKHSGRITSLAWSPDGALLASGGADRYIYGWEGSTLKINKWVFHSSAVNALAWSPDGDKLASGGADKTIFIWSVSKPIKKIKHTNAHQGAVNGIAWVDENTLLSVGDEGAMNSWNVTHAV